MSARRELGAAVLAAAVAGGLALSATSPPPACTYAVPSCSTAVRMAIAMSMSPPASR